MSARAPDELFIAFQAAVAGRYSIDSELGRGGMGVVYLAKEVDLDRPVAIKLLPPDRAADPALRGRFLREARIAAKLSHPNIIPIHVVDEVREFVFFAMAYVQGETLAERVQRRGPLPPTEAARVLREVSWALAHAHGHGVIHRDVKPDNILLETATGRALVADFGIAAAAATDGSAGEISGTPEFMSPEQALGKPLDVRSDIYSFGATAYFTLCGALPFEGRSATEVLAKQVTEVPRPLAAAAGAVPRKLVQVVEHCMAKDPAQRPPSADAVSEQLGVALEQRRELPVALRAFVKHSARLDGGAALLYPFGLLIASGVVGGYAQSVAIAFTTLGLGLTVAPLGALVLRARRLLRQGFGHGDLAPAFKAEIEIGKEERAVDTSLQASLVEKLMRAGSVIGLSAFATGIVMGIGTDWRVRLAYTLIAIGGMSGVGLGVATLIQVQRRKDVDTEFYGRLWTGPVGRLLFRVARLFTRQRSIAASVTHRPTELSIGMAAEQLYESLPKEERAQLKELPDVLKRLGADAQRLRQRHDQLQEALGGAERAGQGAADGGQFAGRRDDAQQALRRERDLLHAKLASTVAALETIRLNLLRLHAGSGSVSNLTTDLGLAYDVAREVDLLLQGHGEVEDLLKLKGE